MTSSEREQDGKSAVPLGPDLVLKVDSRISTGSYAAVVGPSSEFSNGQTLVEGQVVLSTVRAFERRLVVLVDGRRSVKELIHLSGLSEAQAKRHLASLCRRRVLVPIDGSASEAAQSPGTEPGDSRKTPTLASKASPRPSDQDKTVVGVRIADLEATRNAGGFGASEASPAGVPARRSPIDDADTERVVVGRLETSRIGGSSPNKGKPGSGPNNAKPSVTMFWIPSPVEEAAAAALDTPERPRAASPAQGTIVVTGATSGSGPHQSAPWVFPSNPASGPAPSPVGGQQDKSASIPFRLGGYEIATRLNQSGGSSSYICRRAGGAPGSRLFTLKVVRQRSSQATEVIQAFRREARVGALLNHPNLQTVVDVGSYHEQPFLILDYVESISLAELIGGDRKVPVPVLISILLEVLQGLKSAHDVVDEQGMRLGLVHGDVTPHNILVGIDGNARLADFGCARLGSNTRAPEIVPLPMGKSGFLSPEQLCDAPLDERTDLFSLGVVMWTALTGQSLFTAETHDQTVANIFRRRIPPPSEFGAPAGLDEILVRVLSRSPEGRYANAAEMADALVRVATGHDLLGSAVEVGRWVRREFSDTVIERQRRIQAVFGGPPVVAPGAAGSAPAAESRPAKQALAATIFNASAPAPVVLPRQPSSLGVRPHEVPALRSPRRRAPSPAVGIETTGEAKTKVGLQLRVVLLAGLIAFPFTLALTYFASGPVMRRMYSSEAEPALPQQRARGAVYPPAPLPVAPTPATTLVPQQAGTDAPPDGADTAGALPAGAEIPAPSRGELLPK